MRTSQFFLRTSKEAPADTQVISHKLMLRAGMIRQQASGIYTWMPLGLRVLRKIENIVREEMNRAGALEVLMPAVQPAELWRETGRWDAYGPLLLKIESNEREYCFGPTHEEMVTDWVRRELHSYKQLPVNFYQIQTKFRDEIRPRFGVMRAREFIMKDAYSFDYDQESLNHSYQLMYDAYTRVFTRTGLRFRAVMADTGNIGGSVSHEFHVLADSGEDDIFYSDTSQYAANRELSETLRLTSERPKATQTLEKVATPGIKSIDSLAKFLKVSEKNTIKTLLVRGESTPLVALLLRGDHELNEIKAQKHPIVKEPLQFASEEEIRQFAGCAPGSIGPVELQIPIIADYATEIMSDFVCGSNSDGYHIKNVNWERDLPLSAFADLRNVQAGDPSPDGQGTLLQCRGIEVGHVFQLGKKYSEAMKVTVLGEDGVEKTPLMGCYGIGVSRMVAAAIEQNYDDRGIIFPAAIAPFQIALVPINLASSKRLQAAVESLYIKMQALGFEVLLDDRAERPGVMFADMDLIGIPHRFVLGEKGLDASTIEYKARNGQDAQMIPLNELDAFLEKLLS